MNQILFVDDDEVALIGLRRPPLGAQADWEVEFEEIGVVFTEPVVTNSASTGCR